MNQDWEAAIDFVLRMEGGEQAENDPNDPGGLTRFGISQKAYPSLNISALTKEEAKNIYFRDYWKPCGGEDLPTSFAIATFDAAVNMGVTSAKRLLQIGLNVTVDGVIGPETITAAVKAGRSQIKRVLATRLAEYINRILKNPKLQVFSTNWSFRVISLAELIMKQEPHA